MSGMRLGPASLSKISRPLWRTTHKHSITSAQWRRYASANSRPEPKTYFQDPPGPLAQQRLQRSRSPLVWRFVRGSILALVAFTAGLAVELDVEEDDEDEDPSGGSHTDYRLAQLAIRELLSGPSNVQTQLLQTVLGQVQDEDELAYVAATRLHLGSAFGISSGIATHRCSVSSQVKGEVFDSFSDLSGSPWWHWGIYDGYGGSQCAQSLAQLVPNTVALLLGNMIIEDSPGYKAIATMLTAAFVRSDEGLLAEAETALSSDIVPAASIATMYAASAGSGALFALYHPATSRLWAANAGKSRLVVGRWDPASKRYVVSASTREYHGKDTQESERNEFGDARRKWSHESAQYAHEKFGASAAPLEKVVDTNETYTSANPHLTTVSIESGSKPDFVIMASHGLWDKMSSEDAVGLVETWLAQYTPTDLAKMTPEVMDTPLPPGQGFDTNDVYYDSLERKTKWDMSSKHWVTEQPNCATHLVQNALGGNRRGLVNMVLNAPAPFCLRLFDDITVSVVFFGQDTSLEMLAKD